MLNNRDAAKWLLKKLAVVAPRNLVKGRDVGGREGWPMRAAHDRGIGRSFHHELDDPLRSDTSTLRQLAAAIRGGAPSVPGERRSVGTRTGVGLKRVSATDYRVDLPTGAATGSVSPLTGASRGST